MASSSSWAFYERHFAHARLQHYLTHTGGDQAAAMELYRWNVAISGAFWQSLAYFEVALTTLASWGGQVISEVSFGFGHQLVSRHQMFLWPDLAGAFPHAPNRDQPTIQHPVAQVREFRNRLGHHHRVWSEDVQACYNDLLTVAGYIDCDLKVFIDQRSLVPGLLKAQP